MAIKPPNNQKNAIPTRRGWVHPTTGEILVGGSISQKNIDAYFESIEEKVTITMNVDPVEEDDWEVVELDLEPMSKKELIKTAKEWDVEIDKKASADEIRNTISEALF
tara:strand:+ start:359 stop:682 length:324 start_codon:yes stop_codon:yes gene_type:complete